MLALKLAFVGGCYLLLRYTSRPHRPGIPLGLTVLGTVVTSWNLSILARAWLL